MADGLIAGIAGAAVRLCRRAGRLRRVRIAGNVFASELLDAIHLRFAAAGAEVSSSYWSDAQLLSGLKTEGVAAMADMYIPRRAGQGGFFTSGSGPSELDLAVVLFGTPHTYSVQESAKRYPGGASGNLERLLAFSRRSSANFHGLRDSGIRLVLLDFPARNKTDELGLDYGRVMGIYSDATGLDYRRIRSNNRAAAGFFKGRREVRIACPRGTDLSFRLGPAEWSFEDCDLRREWMIQVPGGEAYVPPVRGSAEGVIISGPVFGNLLRISFRRGFVKAFEIEKKGGWRKVPNALVEEKQELAELGVGTNPCAEPVYTGPIFEKTFGTVHLGIGGNAFFGGSIKKSAHRDFLVLNPQVEADGDTFISNGQWRI